MYLNVKLVRPGRDSEYDPQILKKALSLPYQSVLKITTKKEKLLIFKRNSNIIDITFAHVS